MIDFIFRILAILFNGAFLLATVFARQENKIKKTAFCVCVAGFLINMIYVCG